MEYDIVAGVTRWSLQLKVKEYIKVGWVPQGGVSSDNQYGYCQAMVKIDLKGSK